MLNAAGRPRNTEPATGLYKTEQQPPLHDEIGHDHLLASLGWIMAAPFAVLSLRTPTHLSESWLTNSQPPLFGWQNHLPSSTISCRGELVA